LSPITVQYDASFVFVSCYSDSIAAIVEPILASAIHHFSVCALICADFFVLSLQFV
jgi:hypothetical protein